MNPRAIAAAGLILSLWLQQPAAAGVQPTVASCHSLEKVALPDGAITLAEPVAPGQYQLSPQLQGFGAQPGMSITGQASLPANPEFCRIAATLKPSPDSDIKIEVWLPRSFH